MPDAQLAVWARGLIRSRELPHSTPVEWVALCDPLLPFRALVFRSSSSEGAARGAPESVLASGPRAERCFHAHDSTLHSLRRQPSPGVFTKHLWGMLLSWLHLIFSHRHVMSSERVSRTNLQRAS